MEIYYSSNSGGGGGVPATTTKTWTAPSDAVYTIHQAHGGVEVQIEDSPTIVETVTSANTTSNYNSIEVVVSPELGGVFSSALEGGATLIRRITVDINGVERVFRLTGGYSATNFLITTVDDSTLSVSEGSLFTLVVEYGGPAVAWWNADTLGFVPESDEWQFRGAKIDYHAYSQDNGTIIGTIYIAHDSGDHNVTHLEVTSGANDNGTVVLWARNENSYSDERVLFAYRTDGEPDTIRVHWTAQVYYSPEYLD